MSGIKALDKLRGLRDEAASKMVDNPKWVCRRAEEIADEIEAEIERDYMRLPVDADGVPIRVGDKLMTDNEDSSLYGRELFVTAVSEHHIPYQILPYEGDGHYRTGCLANIRHVKPRTLEDVLREMLDREGDGIGLREFNRDFDAFVEHYADEIRAMFGEVDNG